MPVIDLADYLGMPAQAPANPVFNQTRKSTGVASLDREVDDFYKGAAAIDQLYRLQRLAPVFEAQKAQFAYDDIAQKANDLRKKQEIEAQVERAASELAGGNLNPESDDFAVKYRDLATRNPLAFSDPRFKNVAGLYEGQHQNYQQARAQQREAEARAAQARIDAENSAYAYGVPAGTITPEMSIRDINIEKGKAKMANTGRRGTGTQDVSRQMLEKDYELVDKDWNEMKKEGENVIYDADGVEMPNPEFQKLDAERKILRDKLRGFYQSKYSPEEAVSEAAEQQVNPSAAAARSALTGMASAATPFSPAALPAMAISGALPQVPANVAQAPVDTVKAYESLPQKTEDDFVEFAGREDVEPSFRQRVIKDLREFISRPVPQAAKGGSLEEVESREVRLANAVKDAEEAAAIADENNLYREAWNQSKAKIDEALSTMAEASGYTPEQIAASIRSGGVGGVRFKIDGKRLTPKEWLESLVGGKFYEPAAPFKQWANTSTGGQMAGKLAAEPWANIFESYMEEKTKPVASPVPQVNVAPTEWKPGQAIAAPGGGTITRTK